MRDEKIKAALFDLQERVTALEEVVDMLIEASSEDGEAIDMLVDAIVADEEELAEHELEDEAAHAELATAIHGA